MIGNILKLAHALFYVHSPPELNSEPIRGGGLGDEGALERTKSRVNGEKSRASKD